MPGMPGKNRLRNTCNNATRQRRGRQRQAGGNHLHGQPGGGVERVERRLGLGGALGQVALHGIVERLLPLLRPGSLV